MKERDYIIIAQALAGSLNKIMENASDQIGFTPAIEKAVWMTCCEDVASALAAEHDDFNTYKFLESCGIFRKELSGNIPSREEPIGLHVHDGFHDEWKAGDDWIAVTVFSLLIGAIYCGTLILCVY